MRYKMVLWESYWKIGDHSHMLPDGMPLGNWTLCDAPVEDADEDVASCARTTYGR